MRHPFSFSSCSFGVVVFRPSLFSPVFSGLCFLFSFHVRSLGHRLLGFLLFSFFPFCAFGIFPCDYPASSLVPLGLSGPLRVPPFFFGLLLVFLFCLCFSPVIVVSPPPPGWQRLLWGSLLFLGLPLLMRLPLLPTFVSSFALCSTFSAYCGSGCSFQSSLRFFRMLRLRLVLPVFFSCFRILRLCQLLPVFLPVSAYCGSDCFFRFGVSPAVFFRRVLRVRFLGVSSCCASLCFCSFHSYFFFFFFFFCAGCFAFHRFVLRLCHLLPVLVYGFLCPSFSSSSPGMLFASLCDPSSFFGASASFRSPVPLGTSQCCCGLCFSRFSVLLPVEVRFVGVFVPFLCLLCIWGSLSVVVPLWGVPGFHWCFV